MLLIVGAALLFGMRAWQASQLPVAAPEPWQSSGRAIIEEQLAVIRDSPWGQTERGRLLADRVQLFLDEDRVVFSAELGGPRGMWSRGLLLDERIYIRILPMTNGYLHQLPGQIMEAIFHEAVHSLHGPFHRNSLEEEADAFAAGLVAELIVNGEPVPPVLMIDGLPLWEFVRQAYPNEPSNASYEPIGVSLEEIYHSSGRQP